MKSLNAKRIAAIAAGAALLGVGLAFAGGVTFQNVPIISNSGQPVVQVVLGNSATYKPWPSDGVAAANIAAAIGNLAYTSVPVTATVNATKAAKLLSVTVTNAGGASITNPQVYLNVSSGAAAPAGTFGFQALIGSVLNRAVTLGAPASTKSLQPGTSSSNTQYAFAESTSQTNSPASSPYSAAGTSGTSVPFLTVTASTNGGGLAFGRPVSTLSGTSYDNIFQVTNANLGSLLTNSGSYGENVYLWVEGYPVFDQGASGTPVNQFALLSAGGAFQITFNKPIRTVLSANGINQPSINFLGTTYTILNYTIQGASTTAPNLGSTVTSTTDVFGGSLRLAASLVPLTTVYVGQNLTSGPFKVQLQDLSQPNSNGVVSAALAVYYNGKLTNTSSALPPVLQKFNISGNLLWVKTNKTFAGLYQYQKWAQIQLFSNIVPLNSGGAYNSTTNTGWYVYLGWTNSSSGTAADSLQQIDILNQSPTTLMPGQSLSFIGVPNAYKLTLASPADTIGSGFDTVTATTSGTSNINYQNKPGLGSGTPSTGKGLGNIDNITEPADLLTVTSSIPNAFSYGGQVGSSVLYNLEPFRLIQAANSVTANNIAAAGSQGSPAILFVNTTTPFNGLINNNNQLTVTVYGYGSNSASASVVSNSVTLTSIGATIAAIGSNTALGLNYYNVTKITLSEAIPGLTANVFTANTLIMSTGANVFGVTVGTQLAGANVMATLANIAPQILYAPSTTQHWNYANLTSLGNNAVYNQQNGQPTATWTLTALSAGATGTIGTQGSAKSWNAFQFNVVETDVPGQTTPTDSFMWQFVNSTSGAVGAAGNLFQENYSIAGTQNNVTYQSNTGTNVNGKATFRSERGSKVSAITPTQLTFGIAKTVDYLQFFVAPSAASTTTSAKYTTIGPFGIGQTVTGLTNVTIAKVTANATLGPNAQYSIAGINNLSSAAVPSVSAATTAVKLVNLTTTPLVVLDNQASAGSNLILVGSGFVNSLSGQLQKAYNITMSPTAQIDQAYGTNRILVAGYYANQTTAAANAFISQLYANAAAQGH